MGRVACSVPPKYQTTNNTKPASHGQPESGSIGATTNRGGGALGGVGKMVSPLFSEREGTETTDWSGLSHRKP